MPTKPKTFESERFAAGRAQDDAARNRLSHRALYRMTAWRNLSRMVLAEQPICAGYPLPCMNAATDVDHVISVIKRPDLALSRDNLQGLCIGCHTRKTRDGL